MNNRVFIDLDKEGRVPQLTFFQGVVDIKKNGRIIVKNSILENIDMIPEDELRYILKNFKNYISPIVTSQYIPNVGRIRILSEVAPEFKVKFKTEKPGTNQIIPISSEEYFEGEKIFSEILKGIRPEWTELQKYKYLYNKNSQMLSYDLNTLLHTQYSNMHEKYSRNIFTAMSKNWGLCASFAASYDYLCYRAGLESQILSEEDHDYVLIEPLEQDVLLTDSTYDSVNLKFGMKSRNFAISKKQFIKNGHNLAETEASDYEFGELNEDDIKQLDRQTGYLNEFGGEYTDDYMRSLANNLEGNNNFEKAFIFLNRISRIKTVGRPSAHDFETIINFILSEAKDREFAEGIKVYSFISENTRDLPRQIAVEVHGDGINECTQYYILKDGVKSFERVEKIEEPEQCKEK